MDWPELRLPVEGSDKAAMRSSSWAKLAYFVTLNSFQGLTNDEFEILHW